MPSRAPRLTIFVRITSEPGILKANPENLAL
jgi:hypothetical protein